MKVTSSSKGVEHDATRHIIDGNETGPDDTAAQPRRAADAGPAESGSGITAIITRLKAAAEGSAELDWLISGRPEWLDGSPNYNVPRYTRSLDAALTLVPEGKWTKDFAECPEMGCMARIYRGPIRENSAGEPTGSAKTLALALCIAALKARLGTESRSAPSHRGHAAEASHPVPAQNKAPSPMGTDDGGEPT